MSEPRPLPGTSIPVLSGRNLRKVYREEDGSELTILDGVEIDVVPGEFVAITGASGAGKSTLLHLLGCLDQPSAGVVLLAGRCGAALTAGELAAARNRIIGFVFQFHHLLREFTALENVMMPQLIGGRSRAAAAARGRTILDQVGLGARAGHKSGELSGGEQQRVAVARALANEPLVLLADEPSGYLDTHTAEQLHELFFILRRETGVAMVMATHNRELAERADRVLRVKDGQLNSVDPGSS
ncbi:MAG: ABC transporter ATP-binding protein [Gemmatimonadetes bacterium]|nr:ABC transporter ATP-binding protein [Gemmatimonadota bacterium]